MEQTRFNDDESAPIAPSEVRELLTRLTESSVESTPASEVRTLAGLSLQTGLPMDRLEATLADIRGVPRRPLPFLVPVALLLAIGAAGAWTIRGLQTPAAVAPPVAAPIGPMVVVSPDISDTVRLNDVTFGPDGGSYYVDTSFEPKVALLPGLSICATVNGFLWGSGDHRAHAIMEPLAPQDEANLKRNLTDLLRHVRQRAEERHLTPTPAMSGHSMSGFQINLSTYSYYGVTGTMVLLPPPGTKDAEAERRIKKTVDELVRNLQNQFGFNASSRRSWGP